VPIWEGILLLGAFAILRVLATVHAPVIFPDSNGYNAFSLTGNARRPWTVPLLWNLLPSYGLREAAQVALGVVGWSAFALSLGSLIAHTWVRRLAMIAVLLLGLMPQVTGWDATMLSESLSTSLFVLTVALLLQLVRGQSARLLIACLAVGTLWVFARQANVLLYVPAVPLLVAFAFWRLPRRRASWVSATLVVVALWSAYVITRPAARAPARGNAATIVSDRVARNPSAFRFFEARGMPDGGLVRVAGAALAEGRVQSYDADLKRLRGDPVFIRWIDRHFDGTYLGYLIRHLPSTLGEPFVKSPRLVSGPFAYGESGRRAPRSVLPVVVSKLLWGPSRYNISLWLALAVTLALGIAAVVRGVIPRGLPVVTLLLLSGVVGCIVIWNTTDPAMNLFRQFVPVALAVRAGLLIAIAVLADALLTSPDPGRPPAARIPVEYAR
jgi:hypothetical protein